MVLALLNATILFVHRVMTNGDNLDYLFIAGSVMQGDWAEPFLWRFPVGYPFLVAGFSALVGISIGTDPLTISTTGLYVIQIIGVLMAPCAILAIWLWGRTVFPERSWLIATVALFATTQQMAPVYSVIGAEPYFIVWSWLALWGWERALARNGEGPKPFLVVAVACTLLAILFRQIGLAIPLAVLGGLALMGRWRERPYAMTSILCAVAILGGGFAMIALSNPSHLHQLSGGREAEVAATGLFAGKIELLLNNASAYRMTIPQLLLPKVFGGEGLLSLAGCSLLQMPLALMMHLVCLVGMIVILCRRDAGTVTVVYAVISMAIFLVWPYTDGRFFLPLIPALWLFAVTGFRFCAMAARVPDVVGKRVVISFLLLLVAWQLATNAYAGLKNIRAISAFRDLPAWHPDRYELTGELDFADHLTCGMWLSEHAEPNAVVFGEKAAFLGLSSGRSSFYLRDLLDRLAAGDFNHDRGPYYVVVDSFPVSAGYGKPKLEFLEYVDRYSSQDYELVFEALHGAKVYRYRGRK